MLRTATTILKDRVAILEKTLCGHSYDSCFDHNGDYHVVKVLGLIEELNLLKQEITKLKAIVAEVTDTVYGDKK